MNEWSRVCCMNMIGDLGGITALLVFAIGGYVKKYSDFNIDNGMIR